MNLDLKKQIDNVQSMQNEIDFILVCCRVNLDNVSQARIQTLLQNQLDWEWILSSVTCHGVLPLLYSSLNKVHSSNVPDIVRKKLQEAFYVNYFRNEKLLVLLHSTVELCNSKNVKILSFKGPLLSKIIYGDIGFRQISDLDFLMKYSDAETVKSLMLSQGYCIKHDGTNPVNFQKGYSHISFYDPQKTNIYLDFQSHIGRVYSFFRFDMDRIWDRSSSIQIGKNTYPVASNEDLLFILSMHGNNHAWEKLKWICDVSELVQKNPDFNWTWVYQQARDTGILRVLSLSLSLAQKLFQMKIPDVFQGYINRDKKTHQLVQSILSQLFTTQKFSARTLSRRLFFSPDNITYHIHSRERYFDKLRYIFFSYRPNLRKFIPTAKDKELVKLPRFLYFLYYVIKPFRLIVVYGPKLLRDKTRK